MAHARGRVKGQELLPCSSSHLLMVDMQCRYRKISFVDCRPWQLCCHTPTRPHTSIHIWACVRATPTGWLDSPSIYESVHLQLHLLITVFSLHDLEIVARRVISALKRMDGHSNAHIAVTGDLALLTLLPAGWPAETILVITDSIPIEVNANQALLAIANSLLLEESGTIRYRRGADKVTVRVVHYAGLPHVGSMPRCAVTLDDVNDGDVPYLCARDLLIHKLEACVGCGGHRQAVHIGQTFAMLKHQRISLGAAEMVYARHVLDRLAATNRNAYALRRLLEL